MVGNQTILEPPDEPGQAKSGRATERRPMNFTFDKSYWSAGDRNDPDYCSQQTLFEDLGKELLDHAFNGFNACILACEYTVSVMAVPSTDVNHHFSPIDGQTGTFLTVWMRCACEAYLHQGRGNPIV